ncbi:MAG: amidohydrolase family protein [Planctomycetota bacterium]|nr:amidohydrolase family protein [Planctomycetota bacterium]MDA1141580.1 amidohydrolase family protein [Planctomycetota bacterium]
MNYIDAHVHVWTDDFENYPLADGFTPEDMAPKTFYPEDILGHSRLCGVDRVVLIQMSYYQFDNSYMLDVIAAQPDVFRGIAIVDWKTPGASNRMRELIGQGVRGFRIYPGEDSPETWLETGLFSEMFQCGAEENVALCPLVNSDALPAINRMCERFPDTPVIIDHLARIGAGVPIQDQEIDSLCSLAAQRNIKVKVSAFYALGEKKPPHLDLAPMIQRVFEAFGPQRLMWATDCPFQVVDETYEESIALIRDRLGFLSESDKEWLLRKTAEQFFFEG